MRLVIFFKKLWAAEPNKPNQIPKANLDTTKYIDTEWHNKLFWYHIKRKNYAIFI